MARTFLWTYLILGIVPPLLTGAYYLGIQSDGVGIFLALYYLAPLFAFGLDHFVGDLFPHPKDIIGWLQVLLFYGIVSFLLASVVVVVRRPR